MAEMPVTFGNVLKACERIAPYLNRTPVFTCSTADEIAGRKLFFKAENLQKTGSFKARGALNAVRNHLWRNQMATRTKSIKPKLNEVSLAATRCIKWNWDIRKRTHLADSSANRKKCMILTVWGLKLEKKTVGWVEICVWDVYRWWKCEW